MLPSLNDRIDKEQQELEKAKKKKKKKDKKKKDKKEKKKKKKNKSSSDDSSSSDTVNKEVNAHKREKSTSGGASTLALKPMIRVFQSPKQGTRGPQKW